MFSFTKNWFGGAKANPIGVDFGSDCLKMAQVSWVNGEPQLIAAAAAEVPSHIRHNGPGRLAFFAETARDLLTTGGFKGRAVVLALPAASMFIQHLRLAKMDDELLRKALPWEARGKLPIDPSHAVMRHLIAGEIYHDSEPKNEIILMAAARELVKQFLGAAAKAKIDVVGMGVEPSAIVDCFGHVYNRVEDKSAIHCYVDIGCASSRAIIAQGSHILFARCIKVGGEHFNRAVASKLGLNIEDAKMLRIKLCYQQAPGQAATQVEDGHEKAFEESPSAAETAARAPRASSSFRVGGGNDEQGGGVATAAYESRASSAKKGPVALPADPQAQQKLVEDAIRDPLTQLVSELTQCRHYYESTFPNKPVQRLIFVGGEAKQRTLCHHIASEMSLAAQVGDPLVRMGRTTEVGIESGMDRRQAQPGWAVAIGLTLGPTADSQIIAPSEAK